jgi:hypothetical protein
MQLSNTGARLSRPECGWRYGPTHVFYTGVPMEPISKAWVDTFSASGYGVIADPFSGRSLGGYAITSTVDSATQIRRYTNPAYLVPASGRSNLHVFTQAEVQKIGFSTSHGEQTAEYVDVSIKRNPARDLSR